MTRPSRVQAAPALGLLAVLLLASPAWAQSRSLDNALSGVSDPRSKAMLLATIGDADSSGVPVELLLEKISEGVAKQSAPDRIATAVQQLAARLSTSKQALAPSRSAREIAAGAEALQAGASEASLHQLRRVWPVQSLVVPLGVVTEMVAYGVPASQASARVRELMQRGATNAQLVELGVEVQRDIASGRSPGTAFDSRARGTMSLLAGKPSSAFTPPGGMVTYRPR